MPNLARRRFLAFGLLLIPGGGCSPASGGSGAEGAAAGSGTAEDAWACDTPIGWKVGFVDERFGIPGAELRGAIEEAAALWEDAAARPLFRHQPVGGMSIDLEYDERQQQLDEKARQERQLRDWTDLLSVRPGTHAEAERYNRLVDRHNAALEAYRARPTLQFQVAEYGHRIDPASGRAGNRRITVWVVDSRSGLVSALAHELGHALGLEHVADPDALMTSRGESSPKADAALHRADVDELGRVCGPKR